MVELLIKRHANVKAADRKGNTALSLAQGDAVKEALQAALRAEEKKQEAETNAAEVPLGCETPSTLSLQYEVNAHSTYRGLHTA